jgi:hypothetical protein
MEKPKEAPKKLPEKETPPVEEPKTNPTTPDIETPVPPQIMNPSALPEIEKDRIIPNRKKRKRILVETNNR